MTVGELLFGAFLATVAVTQLQGTEQAIILAIVALGLIVGFIWPRRGGI